jgi:hypothetical protein
MIHAGKLSFPARRSMQIPGERERLGKLPIANARKYHLQLSANGAKVSYESDPA